MSPKTPHDSDADLPSSAENSRGGELTEKPRHFLVRWMPAIILVAAIIGFFATGIHKSLSFDELALRYADLTGYVEANTIMAIITILAIYTLAVAAAFPAAWLLTVAIGLVFGWALGATVVVAGATMGASILFFGARSLLAGFYKRKAGERLNQMAAGFRENAVSYMLFLRLVPAFPFLLVNVVPAILGVKFSTYVWTTALGIIPGTIAYAYAGEGLRSIIVERSQACVAGISPCGEALSARDFITTEMLIAFTLLGAVSLMPAIIKKFRGER